MTIKVPKLFHAMTKTTFIISSYHKSTCKILNYSVKICNLTVKQNVLSKSFIS